VGVAHFQVLGVQPHLDLLADQPARHRVAVPLHVDQTALVHATTPLLAGFQPAARQRPQHRQLLQQSRTPAGIELLLQSVQKALVLFPAGKIPAAPQHQGLVHRLLETPMPLLDVAVLVGVIRLDLLADQTVMSQQPLIALRELLLLRQVVHRRAQPIRAVPLRHGAQLPQRVLQPFAQALETLRKTDRHRLPVRVRQHEMVNHVREPLPRDGHAQVVHVREVRRRQPPRFMHLGEVHFLGRPRRGPPTTHLPLQRPQLPLGEPARITALQLPEDRLGLQPGLLRQQAANLHPHLGKGIDPRPPSVRRSDCAG
jgi:hypothetical protein